MIRSIEHETYRVDIISAISCWPMQWLIVASFNCYGVQLCLTLRINLMIAAVIKLKQISSFHTIERYSCLYHAPYLHLVHSRDIEQASQFSSRVADPDLVPVVAGRLAPRKALLVSN